MGEVFFWWGLRSVTKALSFALSISFASDLPLLRQRWQNDSVSVHIWVCLHAARPTCTWTTLKTSIRAVVHRMMMLLQHRRRETLRRSLLLPLRSLQKSVEVQIHNQSDFVLDAKYRCMRFFVFCAWAGGPGALLLFLLRCSTWHLSWQS